MELPIDEFQRLLNTKTYKEIGEMFGVHENTVKHNAKVLGLNKKNMNKKFPTIINNKTGG
jgi:DNA-binding CsgD family transcriptional regulator